MADRWQAKLSRPIVMRDGTKLQTLAEAGAFILRCLKDLKSAIRATCDGAVDGGRVARRRYQ
jgi:hypothetical protein